MNPKTITLILFIILLQSCSHPKNINEDYLPYYHKINEANYLNYQESFQEANHLYQAAFKLVTRPFYKDYKKAAENATNISDQEVYEYLSNGIARGLRLEMIKKDSIFDDFLNTNYWKELEKAYPEKRKEYELTINLDLAEELKEMYELDQSVRQKLGYLKDMEEVDEKNKQKLIAIIKEHGYPGYTIVGEEVGRLFPIMFHHFHPDDNAKYFNDKLNEAMRKGEISPFRNAAFRDYACLRGGEKTTYGTYYRTDLGEKILCPIADFPNLNKRRYQMGLEPIEQYIEMKKLTYNFEEED